MPVIRSAEGYKKELYMDWKLLIARTGPYLSVPGVQEALIEPKHVLHIFDLQDI